MAIGRDRRHHRRSLTRWFTTTRRSSWGSNGSQNQSGPAHLGAASIVAEFVRVVQSGGRLALTDTDWSTLHLDVGDPQITKMVRNGLHVERNRPSNVGRRLADLAHAAGCEVTMETTDTQFWTRWNPDDSPAPEGCFSMASLADDLVASGQLESSEASRLVGKIHEAARRQRFKMSLTMHAVIAVCP